MDIFDYQFGDTPGDLIPNAHHWNINQTSPIDGDLVPDGYGWDCVTGGKGAPNREQNTICRFKQYPGTPNCLAILAVTFPHMDTSSRYVDLWIRMIDDENGYYARLDSNYGSPQVSLYRIADGTPVLLDGPNAVTGMTEDVAVDLKIEAIDDTVKAYVAGTEKCTKTEAAADLIFGNYRVGLAAAYGLAPLGPTVDNLRVEDAASESGLTGGYILKVGEIAYGKAEMVAAGISLQRLTRSYLSATALTIGVKEMHTAPLWRPELPVTLKAYISGAWEYVFRGKMRIGDRVGAAGAEGVEYFAAGPRASSKYVITAHPTRFSSIVWNAQEADEDYEAEYADKEIGEIIKWYFDTYADALRFHGAIHPTDTPYVQAELDAMSVKPTRMDLGGDFESIILSLLSKVPNIAVIIDMDTFLWHFTDFTSSSVKSYAYGGDVYLPSNIVQDDSTGCYTAVKVRSSRREKVQGLASTLDGTLERYWNAGLGRLWTPSKQFRAKVLATVAELVDDGTGDDRPVIRLSDKVLFPGEWMDCLGTFTSGNQDGNAYKIIANTYDQITLELVGGFVADLPGVGDTIDIEDRRANSDAEAQNGFSFVHRRYRIRNQLGEAVELAKDPCATLWQESEDEEKRVPHAWAYEASPGVIVTGMPIIIPKEDEPGCENAEGYDLAEATAEYWSWEEDVREYRTPTAGWYGPAYAESASKWSGGGDPGPDDWGVRREFIIEDSQWLEDSQNAAIEAAADAMLQTLSLKPYGGSLEAVGMEWDLRDLQRQIHFTTAATVRGASTSFESANIIAFETTYHFARDRTVVTYGNSGEFARQWEALKDRLVEKNEQAGFLKRLRGLEDFVECVQQNKNPKTAAPDDNPICATKIRGKWNKKPGGGGLGKGGDDDGDDGDLGDIIDDIIWKIIELEITQETQKEKDEGPPPVPPGGGGEDDDPTSTPEGTVGPVHQLPDGTLIAPRPGGNAKEEHVELEADGTEPWRPKYGPDFGARIIGPIEAGQHFSVFHHKHQRDIESGIWDGAEDTFQLTQPPMAATRISVKLRTPQLGIADYYDVAGGQAIVQAAPATIVFDTQRSDPEGIVSLGSGQFTVVRAGTYLVQTTVTMEGTAAAEADFWIEVNGTPVAGTDTFLNIPVTGSNSSRTVAKLTLAVGDIVDVKGQEVTNTTTVTTLADGSNIQFDEIERPGAGALHEMVEGGGEDWTVNTTTGILTLAVAPPTGSYLQVDYETQGGRVRHSQTILAEIGVTIEDTDTILTESGLPIDATDTLLVEILTP